MSESKSSKFHILLFPWFAMGHSIPYLHLSNELSKRGHKISFLLPNKAKLTQQSLNLHPSLITFHSLNVPQVDGLPPGTETASDIPVNLTGILATAMDQTRPQVEQIIRQLKPHFVFYDFAYWIPEITMKLGIKSISYCVVSAAEMATVIVPARCKDFCRDREPLTMEELAAPPDGYPSTTVVLRKHEAHTLMLLSQEFGSGITFYERLNSSLKKADAIAIRTCQEIEGHFCDYLSTQFERRVLLTGPVLPETTEAALDEQWASWLGRYSAGSVVFCAFGSQRYIDKKTISGDPFWV